MEPVIIRDYPGRTQADASRAFAVDAAKLARTGYVPVSQSWADGRPGVGRVLALGLLANQIRPDGVLTVTYHLKERPVANPGASAAVSPVGSPSAGADDASLLVQSASGAEPTPETKVCPDCAETVKWAARICRFCRFEFPAPVDMDVPEPPTPVPGPRADAVTLPQGEWRIEPRLQPAGRYVVESAIPEEHDMDIDPRLGSWLVGQQGKQVSVGMRQGDEIFALGGRSGGCVLAPSANRFDWVVSPAHPTLLAVLSSDRTVIAVLRKLPGLA